MMGEVGDGNKLSVIVLSQCVVCCYLYMSLFKISCVSILDSKIEAVIYYMAAIVRDDGYNQQTEKAREISQKKSKCSRNPVSVQTVLSKLTSTAFPQCDVNFVRKLCDVCE